MPVYIDPSETRESSVLGVIPPDVPVHPLPQLEEWSGADMMVTIQPFPATTEMLFRKHVEAGAFLIQRKTGLDLIHSVGERMNTSLSKMRATGARQAQCVLLFIGVLTCNNERYAIVDGRETHANYWGVAAAVSKWNDRGGVVENLSRPSLIFDWLKMKARNLMEYRDEPVKTVFPSSPQIYTIDDTPLQIPQLVKDGRVTLATLPGVGAVRATAIWEYLGRNATLADALCLLTNEDSIISKEVKGIGAKTIQNIRAYLGLDEIMQFNLEVQPKYLEAQK